MRVREERYLIAQITPRNNKPQPTSPPSPQQHLNRREQEPSPTPEGAETGGETPKPRRGQERARKQKLHAGMIIHQKKDSELLPTQHHVGRPEKCTATGP